jgi:uncharacterized membrane protein
MQELEPTWARAISVWWLIIWRGVVGAGVIGGVVGFIIGFVGGAVGASATALSIGSSGAGLVIGTVWMVVVVRMALRKQYGDFRLALVPRSQAR